ncbi:hypothetical protein BT93_H3069, partial [Corymbia citriodora subsp. variegata]
HAFPLQVSNSANAKAENEGYREREIEEEEGEEEGEERGGNGAPAARLAAPEAHHPRPPRRVGGQPLAVGLHHHPRPQDPPHPAGPLPGQLHRRTPPLPLLRRRRRRRRRRLRGRRRVYFYVSPYERTRSTLREIGRSFERSRVIGVREECRIREQDFGNFQVEERMKSVKETRERFGRFFYRFPEGESAADVFDRVSSFMESLWRDIDMNRLHIDSSHDVNLIIVSHGLTSRVFLMKWFKWTVEQFEHLNNPGNCEFRVMQLGEGGEYSLAIHHTEEELLEWGLSSEMIEDQKWRACARKGEWNERCPWYLNAFFDGFADSDDNAGEGDDCQCA